MTYTWIVFAEATPEPVKAAWIAANPGVNGWFDGVPPRLAAIAVAEAWTLPHVYVEVVPVEPSTP
jgi:hypothetical protein